MHEVLIIIQLQEKARQNLCQPTFNFYLGDAHPGIRSGVGADFVPEFHVLPGLHGSTRQIHGGQYIEVRGRFKSRLW